MPAGESRLLRLPRARDVATGSLALAEALDGTDVRRGALLGGTAFLRVEQPVDSADAIAWLRRYEALPRIHWSTRGGTQTLAGVGTAASAEGRGPSALRALTERTGGGEAAERMSMLGTMRFDPERAPDPEWAGFECARFILPLLELRSDGEGWTLAAHLRVEDCLQTGWYDAQRRIAVKVLLSGAAPLRRPPVAAPAGQATDVTSWAMGVGALLTGIDAGTFAKVV
ncbi:MAG: hypothetical protein O2894_13390, partial [Planctomycetota bacterium]|nr:hypothetical protein [Planctomycetota bacterium]